ncbi:PREDICTED: 28S ribosomal protein S10, mitochondrial [Ceratosolen solmsi marchali]|uniref:Small ribosomal subunit protein uS10m n=1 Tax=Ceratosolen solmsi marchali TaxID=326594 RepID=A0AAJ6YEG3_9HYME|nr:PREDICTED: 28S ribosomal protein S10, mitochondrial [Ceratosolen solmsi marchali]
MFVTKVLNRLSSFTSKQLGEHKLCIKSFSTVIDELKPAESGTPDKLYKQIELEVRGNDPAVLKSYSIFALTTAKHLGIEVGNITVPYKPIHQRMTLLKSKHVHKKHRVQYEMRTYFRFINFLKLTGSTADTFLEYIERNLPEGVAMKVTKTEIQKLPESISSSHL